MCRFHKYERSDHPVYCILIFTHKYEEVITLYKLLSKGESSQDIYATNVNNFASH